MSERREKKRERERERERERDRQTDRHTERDRYIYIYVRFIGFVLHPKRGRGGVPQRSSTALWDTQQESKADSHIIFTSLESTT